MKKEDFEYGDSEYYIDEEKYLIIISNEIFNEETVEYANKIIERYEKEKDKILDYILEKNLREFYNSIYDYSDEYIKNNIGRPQITINFKKDDTHPEWKFNYAGIIEFCDSNLDEHIISIEFVDDLDLSEYVQIDG